MKKLLSILLAIFALNSFASFETFKTTFDSLVIDDSWGEFRLEYSLYTETNYNYVELAPIVSHIMEDKFTEGLVSMDMDSMDSVDDVMKVFGNTYGDYYCYRLVSDSDYDIDEKLCEKRLRKLVEAAFADEDVRHVTLLNLEGDYYGDWHTIFLLLQNYKTKETLIVEFDLLHEI